MRQGAGFYLAVAILIALFAPSSCDTTNRYSEKSIARAIIDRLEARP